MPVIGAALHLHAVAHVDRQRFQLPLARTISPAQIYSAITADGASEEDA